MRILYNGWPLVYQPNSPAALHLLTILSLHPQQMQAYLALPGKSFHPIPSFIEKHVQATPETASGRLLWEQRSLPKIANQLDCNLIHHTTSTAALFGNTSQIISPTEILPGNSQELHSKHSSSFADRLRFASAQGGITRVKKLLWPSDLPTTDKVTPVQLMPVTAPLLNSSEQDELHASSSLDIVDDCFLYHGPTSIDDLRFLANVWSRAAATIGEGTPLLVLSSDNLVEAEVESLKEEFQLGDTLDSLPMLTVHEIDRVYQKCRAVFHPLQVSAWGGAVRLALGHGKPVIGFETPAFDAMVGPAAYLVKRDNSDPLRALSAALITISIEEEAAEALATAAQQRVSNWDMTAFAMALERVYLELLQTQNKS
jgi:hypothetical protein